MYCGQIDLSTTTDRQDVLKLLVATDEFGLNSLSEYIQEFLIENQEEFLQNDPIKILEIIFQYESFATLKEYCLKIICQNPGNLFENDKMLTVVF